MNKVLIATIFTAGLIVGMAPEAAAHSEGRGYHDGPSYSERHRRAHSRDYYERNAYRRDDYQFKRASKMPRWLKKKKSFRRWYRDSPISGYRFLTWRQLYEIYRWERSYFTYHRY